MQWKPGCVELWFVMLSLSAAKQCNTGQKIKQNGATYTFFLWCKPFISTFTFSLLPLHFPPVLSSCFIPAAPPRGSQCSSPSIGCHRKHEPSSSSPVTGVNWEPNTVCIQFKPLSFPLASWYKPKWIPLDTNAEQNPEVMCCNTKNSHLMGYG